MKREIKCIKCNGTGQIFIDDMSLGQKLKFYREQRGLSLREAGQVVGFSAASLCQMEADKVYNPSFHVIVKLAQCYDINIKLLAME